MKQHTLLLILPAFSALLFGMENKDRNRGNYTETNRIVKTVPPLDINQKYRTWGECLQDIVVWELETYGLNQSRYLLKGCTPYGHFFLKTVDDHDIPNGRAPKLPSAQNPAACHQATFFYHGDSVGSVVPPKLLASLIALHEVETRLKFLS